MVVNVLLSSKAHWFSLILNQFYNDCQENKANLDYDLYQLLDHNFSLLLQR